jgi:hypothetical protein
MSGRPQTNELPQKNELARDAGAILEAAERAAAEIRRDAEQWARRHMEETRRRADELAAQRVEELSLITDELLASAKDVVRQSDELTSALDAATRKVVALRRNHDHGPEEAESAAGSDEEPGSTENVSALHKPGYERQSDGTVSTGAKLIATQMAVEGGSRDTIASRLRTEFGITDPTPILRDAGL